MCSLIHRFSFHFVLSLGLLFAKRSDAVIRLGFDELQGMSYFTGTPVPEASKLSDQFLLTHGVVFRSQDASYVGVSNVGDSASSPPNAIGAVSADNKLDYSLPIHVEFFLPGNPGKPGVTEFVSVRVDSNGGGGPMVLSAFDLLGRKLDSVAGADVNAPTLQLRTPGIHSVEIRGGFGTAFDDFSFEDVALGSALGDCNGNGVEDAEDLASGTSRDCNGNTVPDECDIASGMEPDLDADGVPDACQAPIKGRLELVALGDRRMQVLLHTSVETRGGELGLAYDPARVRPVGVELGAGFPGGEGDLRFSASARVSCPPSASPVAAGLVVGWANNGVGDILPPGDYELLTISFEPPSGPDGGRCSPLRFVDCLGPAVAPILTRLTGADLKSLRVATLEAPVCPDDDPLRRGDVTGEGELTIADAISILSCMFLGFGCTTCPDSADLNDDGKIEVLDAVAHLTWRYLGTFTPLEPYAWCGYDPTADTLGDCVNPICPR